jgi:hypothetical protein
MRMFTPDCDPEMVPPIRPGSHGLFFSYRELLRMLLRIMRSAEGPVRFDHIVSQVLLRKGIEPDAHLRRHIQRKHLSRDVLPGCPNGVRIAAVKVADL